MKKLLFTMILLVASVWAFSQQLTGDQIATIRASFVFQDRIKATLLLKAEYWKELATPNRADVNRRTQKRKQFSKQILRSNYADQNASLVGQYWLAYYQTSSPTLDGNGIPTYATIAATFDPTYDNFAGYLAGDEGETEIDW